MSDEDDIDYSNKDALRWTEVPGVISEEERERMFGGNIQYIQGTVEETKDSASKEFAIAVLWIVLMFFVFMGLITAAILWVRWLF